MEPSNPNNDGPIETESSRLPVVIPSTVFETGKLDNPNSAGALLQLQVTEAVDAWLVRSNSSATRENYSLDLGQFLDFIKAPIDGFDQLLTVRPAMVAGWRDHLRNQGLANSSIRRKLTTLRSLYSYLQTYG